MKKVLGLDVGTNSIGAALLNIPEKFEDYGKDGKIIWCTSRIIPVEADYLQKFESGAQVETKAAERRQKRGSRRLKHRYKLRRTKLVKLFKTLGWLPKDFPLDNPKRIKEIIAEKRKFRISDVVTISDESYREFYQHFGYSEDQLNEIIDEINFRRNHNGKKRNENVKLLPEDWVVYYLRKKGLTKKLTYEELVRIIYLFNQRRGFKSSRKDLIENETTIISYEEFKEKFKELRRNENGEIIALVKDEYRNQNFETKFVSIAKVKNIKELPEEGKKGKKRFRILLEDERIEAYTVERKEKPNWEGKEYKFLITQKLKKGKFDQNIPDIATEKDWDLLITELNQKIEESRKCVGEYFFDELVNAYKEGKDYKIRQNPVYRNRYKEELEKIWKKQCELNSELAQLNNNKEILRKLAEIFYPTQSKFNGPKLKEFLSNDLLHVIENDIIYYQRDLKSQKHLIGECRYEKRIGKEKDEFGHFIESGKYGLKCIPKSSPLYQEFRIWQDIHNIRLIRKEHINEQGKKILDIDETDLYINESVKENLFELFNSKEEISEDDIFKVINECYKENKPINKIENEYSHRVNLFRNRDKLKGNETKHRYRKIFNKLNFDGDYILNNENLLMKLWHADYSNSESDKDKSYKSILSALGWKSEFEKNKNGEQFNLSYNDAKSITELIVNLAPYKKEYGSYSALAIRKLLIFMRTGKYWKHPQDIIREYEVKIKNGVKKKTKKEIERFIHSLHRAMDIAEKTRLKLEEINYNESKLKQISDDDIPQQILKSFLNKKYKTQEEFIKGLNTYQSAYLLYGKHSEQDIEKASNYDEYQKIINKLLKPGSLRNPLVESVVRETCALVKDVWKKFGNIDEIHIELARELKHNTEERARISKIQNENFEEKQRIKKILSELLNNSPFEHYDENENKIISEFKVKPNPENPEDIQLFRLWKEQALLSESDRKKEKIPSDEDIKKYILWLSQKCRSPYTGRIIPLSKLFDGNEYQKEHIIPRSKLKNDSMNNLVIAEVAVNSAKGDELAANFIANRNGYCEYKGEKIKILKYEEYKNLVDDIFKNNRTKRKNLLATEVPEDFIERQINDTRYIGKKLNELLRPILKNKNDIVFTIGSITTEIKNNWGLNEIWKDLLKPRFERLEKILNTKLIIYEDKSNKYHFNLSINKKLEENGIKRLDHRHHALDAIIIAATTREHIRYLNTLNAADTDEEIKKYRITLCKRKIRDYKLPWESFVKDVKEALQTCIISYKERTPIITKPFNKYKKWVIENGKPVKRKFIQNKDGGGKWMAVRKNMFKEPLGIKWLKQTKNVSIKEALKIQTQWNYIKSNNEEFRTKPYVYDDYARRFLEGVVEKLNLSPDNFNKKEKEIGKWVKGISEKVNTGITNKNGKTRTKTIYNLDGRYYEKIEIAEFVRYKTKRMDLLKDANKSYRENLTIQKMKNDLPYFVLEKEIIGEYPAIEQQLIDEGFELEENKKNNPVNRLLLQHILEYNNNPKEAFNAEGLEKLNEKAKKTIGKPIKSITRLDGLVDEDDIFRGAFYEPDKNSMAYFVIYEDQKNKGRTGFCSIPTHKAIRKILNRKPIAEDKEGYTKIILSPGDLVYVPTIEEIKDIKQNNISINDLLINKNLKDVNERIYQVRKFTGKQCYFIKYNIADLILPYGENGIKIGELDSQNLSEYTLDDEKIPIKNHCIKIKVNRLGEIKII